MYLTCRAWLYPCEGSFWVCTTEAAYWKFIFHVPGSGPDCPTVYPTPPPPLGECQLVNGTCKFTESTLKCKTWVDLLYGNKCGPMTEDSALVKNNGLSSPKGFDQYPAPNQLCLPINNSCQWYDPCISWKGLFTNGNICGSLDEYYAFLYGQPPSVLTLHILGRSHTMLTPLASVPLRMTAVIGMVSHTLLWGLIISIATLYYIVRVYLLDELVSVRLVMWDSL